MVKRGPQIEFIDDTGTDDTLPDLERATNAFAEAALILPPLIESFIAEHHPAYSQRDIEAFARLHNVHPGIVVGQLHARGKMQYANLRKLLVPIRDIVTSSMLTDGWGSVAP